MIESHFRKTADEYNDIIESIEKLEITEEEQISKLKAKLRLFDGTILWIREIRIKDTIEAYSYYWLRSDETLIIGWDNAPHHKEVSPFPRHRHTGNRVESTQEKNLQGVLNFIRNYLM